MSIGAKIMRGPIVDQLCIVRNIEETNKQELDEFHSLSLKGFCAAGLLP